MRRFRIGFLVKLGVVVITMLLLGPYLFHLKLSEDAIDDAEEYRQWQLKQKKQGKRFATESLKYMPRTFQANANVKKDDQRQPPSVKHAEIPKMELAVYKTGIRGNFEPPEREILSRPGENGAPVELPSSERHLASSSVREFGFNMVASDKVAMDRVIPDTRHKECPYWHYPENQPTASVILVFHNEGFSTLVRTIHSVINTSPPQFLKEVVLVDDFSDKIHLKSQLEEYINKVFGNMVKLYRNSKREGLIRTRSRGAQLATADVIVFLDAHCECNRNWLVPLLDRIRQNRTTMAVPIVDGVDWNSMKYESVYGSTHHRGIFEWGFFYKEAGVPKRELAKRAHDSEPYWSPTHAGGLFAMDRKYFHELGGYDPGLKIWGGENYELSFKIWQCGGKIEWVPCSRVGHIYRNHMPYGLGDDVDPHMSPIYINYMRVVEVWMEDQFKEYFYAREPSFRGYDFGNVTLQRKFKEEHQCKSFAWFMENIAYDVYEQYPVPPPNKAWGEIRRKGTTTCWDAGSMQPGSKPLGLSGCHGAGHSQQFRLNIKGQIGIGERCILAQNADTLHVSYCNTQPVGPWEWDPETGLIRHKEINKCVDVGTDHLLHLQTCNIKAATLKWDIVEVYPWKVS